MAKRRGHGEGAIFQRESDGYWVGTVELGRTADGKRRRKTVYARTRREVSEQMKALLAQQQQGLLQDIERITFAAFASRWLDHVRATRELRTWVDYEQVARIHLVPALGSTQLTRIRPIQIQTLYDETAKRLAARTVRHHHEVLHNALNQAVEWRLLQTNPTEGVTPPKAKPREMKFLDFDQAKAFIKALEGDRLESLHLAAIMTGMRQGELLGLRWQDIDWQAGAATVQQTVWIYRRQPVFKPPKDDEVRVLPLVSVVLSRLKLHRSRQAEERSAAGAHYQDHDLVWARADGLPLRAEFVLDEMRRRLKDAGLPEIRFHDLRHSAASLLIALGVPIKEVSEILGHAGIEITVDRYGHLMPNAKRDALSKLESKLFSKRSLK